MHPLDACEAALGAGLEGICFTDHVDFDPRDEGHGFFDWEKYVDLITQAKEAFPSLQVYTGFELNWQSEFKDETIEFLKDKPVDFVLGSTHWVSSGFINEPATYTGRSMDDFLDEWMGESIDLLRHDIAHGFAHYDYFYLQVGKLYKGVEREDIIGWTGPLVDMLARKGVSLEINTSALRKGLDEPFPCYALIETFLDAGGTRVHLGSDSHEPCHVAHAFPSTLKRLDAIMKEGQ